METVQSNNSDALVCQLCWTTFIPPEEKQHDDEPYVQVCLTCLDEPPSSSSSLESAQLELEKQKIELQQRALDHQQELLASQECHRNRLKTLRSEREKHEQQLKLERQQVYRQRELAKREEERVLNELAKIHQDNPTKPPKRPSKKTKPTKLPLVLPPTVVKPKQPPATNNKEMTLVTNKKAKATSRIQLAQASYAQDLAPLVNGQKPTKLPLPAATQVAKKKKAKKKNRQQSKASVSRRLLPRNQEDLKDEPLNLTAGIQTEDWYTQLHHELGLPVAPVVPVRVEVKEEILDTKSMCLETKREAQSSKYTPDYLARILEKYQLTQSTAKCPSTAVSIRASEPSTVTTTEKLLEKYGIAPPIE